MIIINLIFFLFEDSKTLNTKVKLSKTRFDTSRNIEKVISKIQKSFDPFKIDDLNLKYSILKEILECQRLLLTQNFETKSIISISDILDEWKLLAIVVDRICFFLYLFAMVLSSTLFFLQDYYGNK